MVKPSYEDLQLAYQLLRRQQNRPYWGSEPVPIRPLGRVFLEPFRQLTTFVAPVVLVAWFAHEISIYTVAATTPVAILLGYLLDRQLKWSINRKQDRELDRDRGRYHAVRTLSFTLSLPPSEITLRLIENMAIDFVGESNRRASMERQRLEAMRTSMKKQSMIGDTQLSSNPTAGAALAAAATETTFSDSIIDEPSGSSWAHEFMTFNPATGLPMAGSDGLGVDVGGNAFGTAHQDW